MLTYKHYDDTKVKITCANTEDFENIATQYFPELPINRWYLATVTKKPQKTLTYKAQE